MSARKEKILRLHPRDNIGIALADLRLGDELATQPVPRGHKIALEHIKQGEVVLKYGQIIGSATADIPVGSHVHTHNLGMAQDRNQAGQPPSPPAIAHAGTDIFNGYVRPDGRVGTRNYVGVMTTVNCSGSVAQFIAEDARRCGLLDEFTHIDGIVPITHNTGCGMAGRGEGYDMLLRTLAGYLRHPNFGAILLVGLGCEVMQLSALTDMPNLRDPTSFRFLTIQQSGGTRATIEAARPILRELAGLANAARRQPVSAAHLTIGLQCGGSDGLSGITANPALGIASDLLVAQGGTSILSETPEIYGAEHLLLNRATSPDIAEALKSRLAWWSDYCARNGGEMDNNPSPGNKRGGLTTILEKSLGAVAKAGSAPLSGVYRYAEPITTKGFVFMDSPGYDPCSVTGQVASGANLILFTTGRGSVSGYKPVPGIKISTNNDLWARMSEDIDINCGDIIDGVPLEQKGAEIYQMLLSIASGQKTKSETLGFGLVEFVPWQIGATM